MSGALNSGMRALASAMLSSFGFDATLKRASVTRDPRTGVVTKDDTSYTIKVSPVSSIKNHEVNEGVLSTDEQTLIAAKDLDTGALSILDKPSIETDKLTIDGKTYRIVSSRPIRGGKDEAAYKCILRK